MNIYSTSFQIEPKINGYDLTINFLDKNNSFLSSHKTTFQFSSKNGEGILVDLFTKNGTISSKKLIQGLFCNKDIKEIKRLKKMISSENSTIMVLDLKNSNSHYKDDKDEVISKCENLVYELLKSGSTLSKSAKKISEELKNLKFILFEGSLKKDILEHGGFSNEQADYLNSNQGATAFCQFAEVFMNGFKFGHKAFANNYKFSKKHYIKPLTEKAFKAHKTQTVLYPKLYKDIYSPQSCFVKTLSPIFSINGNYCDKTSITTLNYEVKPCSIN